MSQNILSQNIANLLSSRTSNRLMQFNQLVSDKKVNPNAYIKVRDYIVPILIYSIKNDKINTVRTLLEQGADPNVKYNDKMPALFFAKKSEPITRLLLEHGADPNVKDILGGNIFFIVLNGNVIPTLLWKGADIDLKNNRGNTPLIHHILSPYDTDYQYLYSLLRFGADVNLQNNDGLTPIMAAVTQRDYGSVRTLLRFQPNLEIKDNRGLTAIDIANMMGLRHMVTLLSGNEIAPGNLTNNNNSESNNNSNVLKIPKNITKNIQSTNECSNNFYKYILDNYVPHETKRIVLEGQTGVNAEGISRVIYNSFTDIYYRKFFNQQYNNKFSIPIFPITEEMKKATSIIVDLAKRTGVKVLIPFPDSLLFLLKNKRYEIIEKKFQIPSNVNTQRLSDKTPTFNNLTNENSIIYGFDSKENIIRDYIKVNEQYLVNNKKWKNLSNTEKTQYYFQNYLQLLGIGNKDNLRELHSWFIKYIDPKIIINELLFDKSILRRIRFIERGGKTNTNRRFNVSSKTKCQKYPNACVLYNFLLNGSDLDRQNFITFATGTRLSQNEIRVLCFNISNDRGAPFSAHTCFNTVDVFQTKETVNDEIIRSIISQESGIYIAE